MTQEPDGILLDQFVRTQDPVAFDQIARRYRAMVFATARRVTRSHHDAEDVAQSCFLELARKAASIHISIAAFLHSTATRRSIDLLRERGRRRKHEQKAAADRVEPESGTNSPERGWEEISPEVDHAIERLPQDYKIFVILYFLRGLTIPDIALETGFSKGVIERRLQVGIRRLRADLAKDNRVVSAGVLAFGLKASVATVVPPGLTAATGRMAFVAASNAKPIGATGSGHALRHWYLKWPAWVATTSGGVATMSLVAMLALHWSLKSPPAVPTTPYDEINRMYSSYMPADDSSRFPLHTTQIKSDAYSFWRGSQPLFYQWCKSNCRDWLADSNSYVLCQVSPNLEDSFRSDQYGNTDDSARIPMQIELLQGMIMARIASNQSTGAAPNTSAELADAICKTYKASLLGDQTEVHLLTQCVEFLGTDRYTDASGNFKAIITNAQGKTVAFLRPSPLDAPRVERMLADAVARNSQLQAVCGSAQPAVRDVRACVRRDALITDGGLVLLVQLQGSGTLLEMKQQTPAPAELADAIPRDQRSPAQRAAEDSAKFSPPGVSAIGWCDWVNESFTVAPLTLYPQYCQASQYRWQDPIQAGTLWAAATAATHRSDSHRDSMVAVITPQLETQLAARCDAYLQVMQSDLQQFNSDWRVARDRAQVNALSTAWSEQATATSKYSESLPPILSHEEFP